MNVEITVLVSVASLLLAYLGYHKGALDASKFDGESTGRMEADIKYIKRLTEDGLIAQKETRKLIDDIIVRVAINEESIKTLDKRIDKMEEDVW